MEEIENELNNLDGDVKLHQKLNAKFQKERDKWRMILQDYGKMYGDMSNIVDLQVNIISDMGYIADYKSSLTYKISERMLKIKKLKAESVLKHINGNSRYTAKERSDLNDNDVKYLEFIVEIYDSQLSFYVDIYNQLNNVWYNIKSRIELEQYRTPKI